MPFVKNMVGSLTLAFEPGKFLVSEAGTFLAKGNVVKPNYFHVFASVDSEFIT